MPDLNTIPLTVDATQAGLAAGTPVYMYVVGHVAAGKSIYYRLDASGMPHAMDEAVDNTEQKETFPGMGALPPKTADVIKYNYPTSWANYGIRVSLNQPTSINLAKINPTNCPDLGIGTAAFSGRVYISIGVPILPFTAQKGGYTAPVPLNPPGYLTLFDWIEFSFDRDTNFNGNTTQVDQFGFELTLDGTPDGTLQGKLCPSRAAIIDSFGPSLAGPFGNGILQIPVPPDAAPAYPSGTRFLRAVSPKSLTAAPEDRYNGPLKTYFYNIIQNCYETWRRHTLVTRDLATDYYTGIVPGSGILTFYQGNYPSLEELQDSGQPVAFELTGTKPNDTIISTSDIWECANTLAKGPDFQKNVGKILAAAYNRGVIKNYLSDLDADCRQECSSFYRSNDPFNQWAKMFHEFNTNKLAYGFPYDDVCNQNPSISLNPTCSVTITVGRFNN